MQQLSLRPWVSKQSAVSSWRFRQQHQELNVKKRNANVHSAETIGPGIVNHMAAAAEDTPAVVDSGQGIAGVQTAGVLTGKASGPRATDSTAKTNYIFKNYFFNPRTGSKKSI